jgi:hypothetical protein
LPRRRPLNNVGASLSPRVVVDSVVEHLAFEAKVGGYAAARRGRLADRCHPRRDRAGRERDARVEHDVLRAGGVVRAAPRPAEAAGHEVAERGRGCLGGQVEEAEPYAERDPREAEHVPELAFVPRDATDAEKATAQVEAIVAEEGLRVLGWRDVPVDDSMIGPTARGVMPSFRHIFVDDPAGASGIELDGRLFVVRKRAEHEIGNGRAVYFPSLSSRTLVYKGMLTTRQLAEFFPDRRCPSTSSATTSSRTRRLPNVSLTSGRARSKRSAR